MVSLQCLCVPFSERMFCLTQRRGSLEPQQTLNSSSLAWLFQNMKPQLMKKRELHFFPQESQIYFYLQIASRAYTTNPPSYSLQRQEVCLGVRWFSRSANGTKASVFVPFIVRPKILLQAIILPHKNYQKGQAQNSGEVSQMSLQSFRMSSFLTITWFLNYEPLSYYSSQLLKVVGKLLMSLGKTSMQGFQGEAGSDLSLRRQTVRQECLGERRSAPEAISFLTIGSFFAFYKVIRYFKGMNSTFSPARIFWVATADLQPQTGQQIFTFQNLHCSRSQANRLTMLGLQQAGIFFFNQSLSICSIYQSTSSFQHFSRPCSKTLLASSKWFSYIRLLHSLWQPFEQLGLIETASQASDLAYFQRFILRRDKALLERQMWLLGWSAKAAEQNQQALRK